MCRFGLPVPSGNVRGLCVGVVLEKRPGDLALVHDVIVHILVFAGLAPERVVVGAGVLAACAGVGAAPFLSDLQGFTITDVIPVVLEGASVSFGSATNKGAVCEGALQLAIDLAEWD